MFQICEILGHPRNEHGEIESMADDDGYDQKEIHRNEWLGRGFTEEEIEHKYNEDLNIAIYQNELLRTQTPDIETKLAEYRRKVIAERRWGR